MFLDHYSYFRYTYIQKIVFIKDTLEDKSAFDTVSEGTGLATHLDIHGLFVKF